MYIVGSALAAVVAGAAGGQHSVVRENDRVEVTGRFGEVCARGEVWLWYPQIDDVRAGGGRRGLTDPAATQQHDALVLRGRQEYRGAGLGQVRVTEAADLLEGVVLQVPDARHPPVTLAGPPAGGGTGVEQPAIGHREDCRVGREVPVQCGYFVPLVSVATVQFVLSRQDPSELIEAGYREGVSVGQWDESGVPACVVHVSHPLVTFGLRVELIRVRGAAVLLLFQGELLGDAVDVVRDVVDMILSELCDHRSCAFGRRLDPDVDTGAVHHGPAIRIGHLVRGRYRCILGTDEGDALGRDEPRTLLQNHRATIGRLVSHCHRSGRARDVRFEHFIFPGAAGYQQLAVGQERVSATEHVVGCRDEAELVRSRVPEQRRETAGLEALFAVPGACDDQYLSGGQQRGVHCIDPKFARDVEDAPVAEGRQVVWLGCAELVPFTYHGGADRAPRPRVEDEHADCDQHRDDTVAPLQVALPWHPDH